VITRDGKNRGKGSKRGIIYSGREHTNKDLNGLVEVKVWAQIGGIIETGGGKSLERERRAVQWTKGNS